MNINARRAVVMLLKGLFYKSDDEKAWNELIENSFGVIKDYFEVIGLEAVIDESEGYAYLQNIVYDEDEEAVPKLIRNRELSYKVSLLCVLLRKRMVDFDMQSDDAKAIITLDDMKEMMLLFMDRKTDEVKMVKEIQNSIKKVQELGFLRAIKNQEGLYEIKRSIKAFVDAQWLDEFSQRLQEYKEVVNG